ncbi:hypothetical protein PEC302110_20110 [Pectobacterium araliae]|uniref:Uncharacterized protein n=1 Tax=Pectobacterium araliae TaxID=3073862 RepID=A0AAN0KAP2_9GAMM|nr:hypothetical protein PEC302110_20110 [Pectobacterium sp. MAFF 302110]
MQIGIVTGIIAVLMLLTAPKLTQMTQDVADEPMDAVTTTASA